MDLSKLKAKISEDIQANLIEAMTKFEINTPLRASHFLAQSMHESGGFKQLTENLNYSVKGLVATFPKYFPGNLAATYARKPVLIASKVYASRMGNGDEKSQEGWKYRGRGYIQLTGKDNYKAFGTAIGEDLIANPELVATPKYAALSAAWFFNLRGLNKIADEGSTRLVIEKITKKINGGLKGIEERESNFRFVLPLLMVGN